MIKCITIVSKAVITSSYIKHCIHLYLYKIDSENKNYWIRSINFSFYPHARTFFHCFQREMKGAGEREREKHQYEGETSIGCPLHAHRPWIVCTWTDDQPHYLSVMGLNALTNWATLARAIAKAFEMGLVKIHIQFLYLLCMMYPTAIL